jgi:hypothetical protein
VNSPAEHGDDADEAEEDMQDVLIHSEALVVRIRRTLGARSPSQPQCPRVDCVAANVTSTRSPL